MSTFTFLSFSLLLLFLINISCSSIYQPVDVSSYEEEENNPELDAFRWMIRTKSVPIYRLQRSRFDHPRFNRNAWFRVSTYQHMKPNGASEEKTNGDNLMRWG